jgi:hypothetical protein
MKKVFLVLFALATALAISPVASAQNYDFTFTGVNSGSDPNASGIGTLTVVGGVVTGLTGTFDGTFAMNLVAPGGYAGNDNLFFAGGPPYFDFAGISFAANLVDYNLFYDNGSYILDSVTNPVGYASPSTQINFSVPEGGSSLLYLLLAGGFCFGFMFFGSRNRVGSRTIA